MKYLIVIILALTYVLYTLYREILKVLKVTSIVTISSGLLSFIFSYFIKLYLNSSLSFINISKVTDILIFDFVLNGIYLLILGLIEFFVYFTIDYILTKRKISNV